MEQSPIGQPGQGGAADAGRSYVNAGVVALLCYFLCYLPGLILNLYWLWHSSKTRQLTGRTPEGQGFLIGLLIGAGVVMPAVLAPCLAILAAIAVPNFLEAQTRSKVSRARADMRTIATAIESYHIDKGQLPAFTTLPEMTHDLDLLDDEMLRQEQVPTFARKNWQGSEDPGANSLSTPIAYLSRLFEDPFASPQGAGYRYWHDGEGWIIWSPGPERKYTITDPAEVYSGTDERPSEALLLHSYDPTNGTVSPGDIWRIRQ